jgi:hypothetical protein
MLQMFGKVVVVVVVVIVTCGYLLMLLLLLLRICLGCEVVSCEVSSGLSVTRGCCCIIALLQLQQVVDVQHVS